MTKDQRSEKGKVDEGKRGREKSEEKKKQEKKSVLTIYISAKGI